MMPFAPDIDMPQEQVPPAPLAPPALPAQAAPSPEVVYIRKGAANVTATPTAAYEAALAQRDELKEQLESLRSQRNRITDELTNTETRGVDRQGLETRLQALDARIVDADKALAQADANVSQAAGVPTAVAGHEARMRADRQAERAGEPNEAPYIVGTILTVALGLPISIAYARRIWRRSAAAVTSLPAEVMERLSHLDQAMESIAIEVERIGEGQRFITRVMTDANSRAVGAGAAQPVQQGLREAVPVRSGETAR